MKSKTAWDVYIRSLTPEQPATLADHVQVGLIGELKFTDLQRTISSFSAGEKSELQSWYSAVARKLVRADDTADRIKTVLSSDADSI
jgi:hypothetical protein